MFSAQAFLNEVHENSSVFRGPSFYRFVNRVFGASALFQADDTQEVFLNVADGFIKIPKKFLKYFGEVPSKNEFTAQYNIELLIAQLEKDFDTYMYMNLYELSPVDATKYLAEYYKVLLTDKKRKPKILLQEFKGEFEREGHMILQVDAQVFAVAFHRPTLAESFPNLSLTTVNVYDTRSFETRLLKFALDFMGA